MRRLTAMGFALGLVVAAGCSDDLEAGGDGVDAGVEDDPLVFEEPAPAGSLEALQRDIIQERCSGEPGLCHNGQFEPNLSTTANTYAYLVRRPATENFGKLRVSPGDPASSFLIDKLRNINGVGTQMPLGAEPLTEEEIGRFETWINDGALREPGATQPPALNNPPKVPELAVFDGATRLDRVGVYTVPINTTLTLRQSVEDFETDDADMFLAGVVISTNAGGNVALVPGVGGQDLAVMTFDSVNPPMGTADLLNYRIDLTFGASVDIVLPGNTLQTIATAGVTFTPIALYVDLDPAAGGIIAVKLPDASFTVQ